uniref:Uncharacterized protein n=1 Tax=Compsopogon caeruleus TaxID=31354 RepID=A0A7S1XGL1_9RHOD|mmetsp:Transcript_7305/g.14971  ORF Transcript_7305/g.14971 Transcript_7305/m.14971 type:complete len:112 (+) Transcript_7305:64-399(+)|eukprot:CAMPEP_0184679810 /NCGR_PEP_ID=MMETSP0312-20130426/2684_1 /TAXON_ID=31354 /ORGANISM="Compsopogon coeruleus, Strain SAG 36.94" /LENGTH=111 /DNA_ID=CAMNT_0027129517 /DNA_START=18 /DNA_END=353 /DNA_ORIENTATION=-
MPVYPQTLSFSDGIQPTHSKSWTTGIAADDLEACENFSQAAPKEPREPTGAFTTSSQATDKTNGTHDTLSEELLALERALSIQKEENTRLKMLLETMKEIRNRISQFLEQE